MLFPSKLCKQSTCNSSALTTAVHLQQQCTCNSSALIILIQNNKTIMTYYLNHLQITFNIPQNWQKKYTIVTMDTQSNDKGVTLHSIKMHSYTT